jgi:hypothetical protein
MVYLVVSLKYTGLIKRGFSGEYNGRVLSDPISGLYLIPLETKKRSPGRFRNI